MVDKQEQQRLHDELVKAGVTRHNMRKDEVKHLYRIVHPDEHIMAAINGRANLGSVMIVATDKRIFYLDCKPFYTTVDELTYDIVSGVLHHIQGMYAQVTMHTRAGDYSLRFVNTGQADRFVEYLETKRLAVPATQPSITSQPVLIDEPLPDSVALTKPSIIFLQTNALGVLSTSDRTGNVHGAAVCYLVDNQNQIYILTKSDTTKSRNILGHRQVALTIYDEFEIKTLQIQGIAVHVSDRAIATDVMQRIVQPRRFGNIVTEPPVTKLPNGSFVVLKIHITSAKLSDFKK